MIADDGQRVAIARRMYAWRFGEVLPHRSLDVLRGIEGARMKESYRLLALQIGVNWRGRNYDRARPQAADEPNAAIAVAATGTIPQRGDRPSIVWAASEAPAVPPYARVDPRCATMPLGSSRFPRTRGDRPPDEPEIQGFVRVTSLPQRVHLPLQQAVSTRSTPSAHCSASRATPLLQPMPSFTRESGGTLHVAVMGVNRIGKEGTTGITGNTS